jgi:hypothetical protein
VGWGSASLMRVGAQQGWGLVRTGSGDPGGHGPSGMVEWLVFWVVWVCGLEVGTAEEQVSCWVWVWGGAVAWKSPRGRELCRPTG